MKNLRPRVLVAEDDPVFCQVMERTLGRSYDVQVAVDGQGVLDQLAAFDPDVLLCDLVMPGIPSLEVIREIRRRETQRTLPILVMSGSPNVEAVTDSMDAGADGYAEKPFTEKAILAKLETLVSIGRLRRRAAEQQRELAELQLRHDRETSAASAVLGRMLQRGEFPADVIRQLVVPAFAFSGDVVCGTTTSAGHYRWMLADVTGHTLSSALVTIPIAMLFYGTLREMPLVEAIDHLELELGRLLPVEMFCTAVLCELDLPAGTVTIWNGGMPDVLIRDLDHTVRRVPSVDPPLGANRYQRPEHELATLPVESGAQIYIMSDGLTEVEPTDGSAWGTAAIAALLAEPTPGFDHIVESLRRGGGRALDDVSLVEVSV